MPSRTTLNTALIFAAREADLPLVEQLLALIWPALLSLIFLPLSMRAYRRLSR